MKKLVLFALVATVFGAGCATNGTTETASTQTFNAQNLTLEQALEKSAETRQKLLDAKQQYEQAKVAAEVAAGKKTAAQAAQDQVQKQIDTAKKQIQDEKNAWAELLK
ncbi:MAG: hypothetical protein IKP96_06250 [Elusimicrobiaceae bacterium]|nr:hypothetical protein [Elusimicrobiaceae bacterium]